jgi:hypothetical protein
VKSSRVRFRVWPETFQSNKAVIASEAKQSIFPSKKEWIASSWSLSSGAHSRDPLAPLRKRFAFVAGNDEERVS